MATEEKINVLLAGSQVALSKSLEKILGDERWINIIGSTDSETKAVELAGKLSPEVIVMDLDFAGDGLKASREVLNASPDSKIIVLSVYDYIGKVEVQTAPTENTGHVGSIEWISKNSNPAKLLNLISKPRERGKRRMQ